MSLFLSCPKSSVTRRNERLIKKSYGNIRPPLPTYSPNDKKNERTRRKARSRETGRRNLCGIMVGAINDVTSCCHALKLISPEEKKCLGTKSPFFFPIDKRKSISNARLGINQFVCRKAHGFPIQDRPCRTIGER